MGGFFSIIGFFVIVFIIVKVIVNTSKNAEADNKRKFGEIAELSREYNNLWSALCEEEKQFLYIAKDFFASPAGNYQSVNAQLNNIIVNMKARIAELERINSNLASISAAEERGNIIAQKEYDSIPPAEQLVDRLKAFSGQVHSLPATKMLDENHYGKINTTYWNKVGLCTQSYAEYYLDLCEYILDEQFNEVGTSEIEFDRIEIKNILECVWFYALAKTFSATDFQRATNIFYRFYKNEHVDLVIADLYVKKRLGGEETLRDAINDFLKKQHSSRILTLVASGLMWMNAYQAESIVLQHMLTSGKEMTAKAQERLHSLVNGGGKAPGGFEVRSSAGSLYFDVSALAWKDDEYNGLFENLAFQDKTLSYSLAVRDENKDLFIPQGITIPNISIVLDKFKHVFAEEYGSDVVAQSINCIALSGSGEEKMDGILAISSECKQLGILIHIARIGKKLIIKFYTLFMPTSSDLAVQKQQALSIFNKLSPSVSMWESSLKDTMLIAVEQLLNTNSQSSNTGTNNHTSSEEPIF